MNIVHIWHIMHFRYILHILHNTTYCTLWHIVHIWLNLHFRHILYILHIRQIRWPLFCNRCFGYSWPAAPAVTKSIAKQNLTPNRIEWNVISVNADFLWRPSREKDFISLPSEGARPNQDCICHDSWFSHVLYEKDSVHFPESTISHSEETFCWLAYASAFRFISLRVIQQYLIAWTWKDEEWCSIPNGSTRTTNSVSIKMLGECSWTGHFLVSSSVSSCWFLWCDASV